MKVYDLFITCDVSALDRLAVAGNILMHAKKTACIDHHVSNNGFADVNHVRGDDAALPVKFFTDFWMQIRSIVPLRFHLYGNGT